MSNIANIKKKLALLELPGIQGVLFDALVTYKGEARGEEIDVSDKSVKDACSPFVTRPLES